VPSEAVTTIAIEVVCPAFPNVTGEEALPEAVLIPLTVTVEPLSLVVGVTVIDVTLTSTLSEYAVVAAENDGEMLPEETAREDRVSTVEVEEAVPVQVNWTLLSTP